MKIGIFYATKYGNAKKIAETLREKLSGHQVDIFNLQDDPDTELSRFDLIILGGSVYYGRTQKKLIEFTRKNQDVLLGRKIALFLSAGEQKKENQEMFFTNNFPKTLLERSVCNKVLGFGLNFDKMNFFERFIIKVIQKVKENKELIYNQEINSFIKKINIDF